MPLTKVGGASQMVSPEVWKFRRGYSHLLLNFHTSPPTKSTKNTSHSASTEKIEMGSLFNTTFLGGSSQVVTCCCLTCVRVRRSMNDNWTRSLLLIISFPEACNFGARYPCNWKPSNIVCKKSLHQWYYVWRRMACYCLPTFYSISSSSLYPSNFILHQHPGEGVHIVQSIWSDKEMRK